MGHPISGVELSAPHLATRRVVLDLQADSKISLRRPTSQIFNHAMHSFD
jgi:hypothetical protein